MSRAILLHGEGVSESNTSGTPATRVLIADDHPDAAESMAILLRINGYDVQNAFDGEEALRIAEQFRPHAILLDIGMPLKDGYEVAREIRSHSWGRDMLLIAVTGWGQEEQRQLTAEAGFNHHFVKPVHPRQLKPVIDEFVASRGT